MISVLNSGSGVLLLGDLLKIRPALHEVVELCGEARLLASKLCEARVVGCILLHLKADDLELAFLAGDDALDLRVLLLLAKAQAAFRFVRGTLLRLLGLALLLATRFLCSLRLLSILGLFFALFLLVVGVAARVEAQAPSG